MGDDVTGEALREAMVAYRTRWEMVAAVEAEELRAMPMETQVASVHASHRNGARNGNFRGHSAV
jgi:molybdenum cofactor biosynthesis enzyme